MPECFKIAHVPEKIPLLKFLKQNEYLAKQCIRTPSPTYWLLIFLFIRKWKVKRNGKKKRDSRERECERDNFLYAGVNLKMNFEQRIDGFYIYKYAARLFLLPPRTCLPPDRWTINVKATGGRKGAKG